MRSPRQKKSLFEKEVIKSDTYLNIFQMLILFLQTMKKKKIIIIFFKKKRKVGREGLRLSEAFKHTSTPPKKRTFLLPRFDL